MFIFNKNKILVHDGIHDFDSEYINSLNVIHSSIYLPENWHTLPQWAYITDDSQEFITSRELWHLAGSETFARAGGALIFAEWFRDFRICPRCGGELVANNHDYGRKCTECGKTYYAPQSPAIIAAVEREGKLLLAHNTAWPDERYSVIAGFVEPGESLEMTVRREIREEVNIEVDGITYFGSQVWPFPNSLMLGFTAEYASGDITPDGIEIANAGWFTPEEVRRLNLPDSASIARRLINNFLDTH